MPSDNAGTSRALFSDFVQIGAVVGDLEASMHVLTDVFGVGPFRVIDWPPPDRQDVERYYHGKPAAFTARMAFSELGPVELELIQPVEGPSIWADFLAARGPGIHHIRFNVTDLDSVIEYLGGHGIDATQMGSGIRPGTMWANFDTEDRLGFTIEVMKALAGTNGRTPHIVDGRAQP